MVSNYQLYLCTDGYPYQRRTLIPLSYYDVIEKKINSSYHLTRLTREDNSRPNNNPGK